MSEDIDKELGSMGEVTDDDRLWAMLSWVFWLIAVIALLVEEKKNRPFIRYHAWHSIVAGVIFTVIAAVTVGCGAPVFIISLYFAYRAYMGDWVTIPVITDFIKNQGWA